MEQFVLEVERISQRAFLTPSRQARKKKGNINSLDSFTTETILYSLFSIVYGLISIHDSRS